MPQNRPFQFGIRALMVAILTISIPVAAISFFLRRQRASERAVASAVSKISRWGGAFDKGQVDGDFYVALQQRGIKDEQLIDIARDLREFPGPWLDQRHTIVLDVSGNPITDAAIPHLVGVNFLSISLANTRITDRSIPHLERFEVMNRLNVSQTALSDAGIRRLRQTFPGQKLRADDLPLSDE